MKTLLVKPYNLTDHIQPSLGLGYLAGAIRSRGDVRILDCIKENIKIGQFKNALKSYNPDFVGFQCYTFDMDFIREALCECRSYRRGIITAIGGPHPSALPRESFEYFNDSLDFIFVGEAERALPLLLDKLSGSSSAGISGIPGLAFRDDGTIKINQREFVDDLDTLGMPAWDLIRPEEYPESQHGAFFKKFPIAPIMLTRGCPFACTFCAGHIVSGRRIRKHSPDFIINQIKYLYDRHKIREFHIIDDNFIFDKVYAKEFLRKLIDLDLDISWATPNGVRIDSLDEELLKLMKESGLYLISLGIESGSDRVLSLMKKNITINKIRGGIKLIHRFGIDIAGFFIIGFPGETVEDIKKTIRFSLDLGLIRANYFTYLPFPGTESYSGLVSSGEINKVNWDRFYFMSAPYSHKGISNKQLKSLQRSAFLKFYIRPRIILKNLSGIKSFRHFGFLLKRFFHWIIMK